MNLGDFVRGAGHLEALPHALGLDVDHTLAEYSSRLITDLHAAVRRHLRGVDGYAEYACAVRPAVNGHGLKGVWLSKTTCSVSRTHTQNAARVCTEFDKAFCASLLDYVEWWKVHGVGKLDTEQAFNVIKSAHLYVQSPLCEFGLSSMVPECIKRVDRKVVVALKKLKQSGTTLFLISDGKRDHVTDLLDYALPSWRELFEIVIAEAHKSKSFFDPANDTPSTEIDGVLSVGGSARSLGFRGDVVYIGDHVKSDVIQPKRVNWSTVAFVPEMLTQPVLIEGDTATEYGAELYANALCAVPSLHTFLANPLNADARVAAALTRPACRVA